MSTNLRSKIDLGKLISDINDSGLPLNSKHQTSSKNVVKAGQRIDERSDRKIAKVESTPQKKANFSTLKRVNDKLEKKSVILIDSILTVQKHAPKPRSVQSNLPLLHINFKPQPKNKNIFSSFIDSRYLLESQIINDFHNLN